MSDPVCNRCDGNGHYTVTLKDLGGRQPHGLGVQHVVCCEQCDGKGRITEEIIERERRSWGIEKVLSVRKGSLTEDLWLDSNGNWGLYKNRKKFKSEDEAEAFVRQHFGPDFENFGIF